MIRRTTNVTCCLAAAAAAIALGNCNAQADSDQSLKVGCHAVDVTPDVTADTPIWLAGLESGRQATSVHDKLYARAIVLQTKRKTVALLSVDSIGVQYPTVLSVRERLPEIDYVLIASTHTHSAPDCVGLWGPSQTESGVTPGYMQQLETGIVEAVRQARAAAVPATAVYGTADNVTLLGDYRLPKVYDSVLRTIRFDRVSDSRPCGILVQWNAHGVEPRSNPKVSRDFCGVTVDELEKRHGCQVTYFSGAVGGLMGSPKPEAFLDEDTIRQLDEFKFIDLYGKAIADLTDQALAKAETINLTPLHVASQQILIPMTNPGYRQLLAAGILKREVFEWTGDANKIGEPLSVDQLGGSLALRTEIACLRLGDLHVAAIPGELYPEIVYGEYQEPADPGADFPDAPLERPVFKSLPNNRALLLGLANDEIGYIVPKRQWDVASPFCYERSSPQYGEVNSVGPDAAPVLTEAFHQRVLELNDTPAASP